MATDIEQLLAYGRIGLETGYYEQARGYFEQVLALDPTNQEAKESLTQVDEILRRKAAVAVEPIEAEVQTEPPLAKRIWHSVNSASEWIRKKRKEYAEKIAERNRLAAEKREEQDRETAKRKEEKAKEIEEVKQAWAEERVRRGNVPLQLGQCPECGKIDSYRKKDDSGCVATGIIVIIVVGGLLFVLTTGSMEVCVGSGILIFLLLLVNLLLPDNYHCRFCGAVWRA